MNVINSPLWNNLIRKITQNFLIGQSYIQSYKHHTCLLCCLLSSFIVSAVKLKDVHFRLNFNDAHLLPSMCLEDMTESLNSKEWHESNTMLLGGRVTLTAKLIKIIQTCLFNSWMYKILFCLKHVFMVLMCFCGSSSEAVLISLWTSRCMTASQAQWPSTFTLTYWCNVTLLAAN